MKRIYTCAGIVNFSVIVFITVAFLFNTSSSASAQSHEISSDLKNLLEFYNKKIYFTENKGQWPGNISFKAVFPLGQAIATPNGMMLSTYDTADTRARYDQGMRHEQAEHDGQPFTETPVTLKGHAWMMNFVNHSPAMRLESKSKHWDVFNYFHGDPGTHRTNVANYQELWYHNVYDKVDVRYYPSANGSLEYDLICAQGFDKQQIELQFNGITLITKVADGSLVLKTSVGEMILPSPVAYQKINGVRKEVESGYIVIDNNTIQFEIGNFDATQTLIIDPIALRWATWINSSSAGDNHGHCIWVDPSDGAIYIANRTVGSTNNITIGAFDETPNGDIETVIGKYYEPATIGGAGVRVWQTYIGGMNSDNPYAMEQGPDGNIYITGATSSFDFPMLGGPAFSGSSLDNRTQFNNNIYILKINQSGNSIKSAVVGGDANDGSFDIRITDAGDILVAGRTNSSNLDSLYPGSGATDSSSQGSSDILLFKINQDLSSIAWMRNYGGSGDDQALIMKMNNSNGDIFLAGSTNSYNFPVLNARQPSQVGFRNGFLQRLRSDGSPVWSSYFNSDTSSQTSILCMEFNTQKNRLYFGGTTGGLNPANVSLSGVFNNLHNGGNNDLFVAVMDTGQNFIASTYIGGTNNEGNMMGLNLDLNDDVYVFGYSNSNNFPVTSDALQPHNMGSNDKVFFKLSSTLGNLVYSTYYGGTSDDYDPIGERGIKFSNCRIYTLVTAKSYDIPLTQGAVTTTKLSSSFIYEPGLVVWANPPDLSGNTLSGNQQLCQGVTPSAITGSAPTYILPSISRNDTISAYPGIGFTITYQWQSSTDSVNWTNIAGATGQDLTSTFLGPTFHRTFYRRVIGGDACVITGETNQIIVINTLIIQDSLNNISCSGTDDGSIITNAVHGVPPYTYLWDNGINTASLDNLPPGDYTVVVTDGMNCSNSAFYSITEPLPLAVTCTSQGTFCNSSTGSISSDVSGGTAPYIWMWSNGETVDSIYNLPNGIYDVTITDTHGCTAQSLPVDIQVANALTLTLSSGGPFELCEGDSVTVTAISTGAVNWQWYRDGIAIPGATNASYHASDSAHYYVIATSQTGCTGTSDSISVSVSPVPVANAGPDAFICPGDSVMLTASGGDHFLWSNGETSQSITVTPQQAADYWVSISNTFCPAEDTDSISVSTASLPAPDIAASDNPALGNPITFTNASGDSSIVAWWWDFGDGSGATVESLHHTYTDEGTYTVVLRVENQYGCTAYDTLVLDIIQSISIPNIITPNGDGNNDVLDIKNNGVDTYNLIIFNRWGLLVFEDEAKDVYWDGKTESGVLLSEGTYFYILNVKNKGSLGDFKQTGFITLMR